MKKNYVLFAAALMALASCSSDDLLGGAQTAGNETSEAIQFASETGKMTRAANGTSVGATAANLLGKKFFVLGTKGTLPTSNPTETIVFDNYEVDWTVNTAGTSEDNTNDWKYVGIKPTGLHAGTSAPSAQTVKYWDFSAAQYDFIAYSLGENTLLTTGTPESGKIVGTAITTPRTTEYKSYTLKSSSIDDLAKCYYTDVVTVEKGENGAGYKKAVTLTFKNLTAKVRVAFYETIPGYSVSGLKFYTNDETKTSAESEAKKDKATLYTTTTDKMVTNADITVTYPIVGSTNKENAGYNKAFVSVGQAGTSTSTTLELGSVNYNNQKLATSAKDACMAGEKDKNYYTSVLPTASNGKPLTLRMDYTLTSTDGSGETIHVYGAKAVVPAAYTQWQPNYAYTYIFKISDNTNGSTSTVEDDPEGLFPITFDAVVADIDNNDFTHESITTVSTPSVTSYAWDDTNKKVVKAYGEKGVNDYPAGSNIYFSVAENGTSKTDLNNNGTLYTIDDNHTSATEAEVIDALQVPATTNGTTGRNGIILTKVTNNITYPTTIPTEDGKTINVTENSVALLSSSSKNTYAYVYLKEKGTPSYIYTAIIPTEGQDSTAGNDEYYTDPAGKSAVAKDTKLQIGKIYYKKYTNNNNIYGVKVVKVVDNTQNITPVGE